MSQSPAVLKLLLVFGMLLTTIGAPHRAAASDSARASGDPGASEAVEFFQAVEDGQADVQFIARNDREARVLITNNTDQPLNLRLPDAFAGVHALAQFGAAGAGGRAGGGRAGGGFGGGGGGGMQGVGGGMGGMGMMGGGMGMFSIPPEQTARIDVPVVCLDHGLRNPSSSKPYVIVPAEQYVDRPAVIELLKAFGRGELDHRAAQAAAWHLHSGLTWDELAAKRQGTRLRPSRAPYFTPQELQAAVAYANEAHRLAEVNRHLYERDEPAEEASEFDSESRSTTDLEAIESEAIDNAGDEEL